MRKIVAVCGEPGTGKTTLFRAFMGNDPWENFEPAQLVNSMRCAGKNLVIIGKYEPGEVFAGTDRLSMACQPAVQSYIENTTHDILFEGDRLTNGKFFDFLMGLNDVELHIVALTTSDAVRQARYKERGSEQSEQFLRGRATKMSNILGNFDYRTVTTEFKNETLEQQAKILEFLRFTFMS